MYVCMHACMYVCLYLGFVDLVFGGSCFFVSRPYISLRLVMPIVNQHLNSILIPGKNCYIKK